MYTEITIVAFTVVAMVVPTIRFSQLLRERYDDVLALCQLARKFSHHKRRTEEKILELEQSVQKLSDQLQKIENHTWLEMGCIPE